MLPWLPARRHCDIGSAAWVGFLFPGWPSWAIGDLRHMVQLWATVPEACPGTIKTTSSGKDSGKNTVLRTRSAGFCPPFCVVLGRSLSFSEHTFLHRLSDKVGLGKLEFLCNSNVYSSGDSIGTEVYPIQLNKTML